MPETLIESLESTLSPELTCGDVTILSDRSDWISLRMVCRIETAIRVAEFFQNLLVEAAPLEGEKLAIAIRELLLNAVEHGGDLDPGRTVDLTYIRTARSIICYIRDPGQGFSPDNLSNLVAANLSDKFFSHLEHREQGGIRPGGFGLRIVRNVADELLFSAKGNEVVFIKYLQS